MSPTYSLLHGNFTWKARLEKRFNLILFCYLYVQKVMNALHEVTARQVSYFIDAQFSGKFCFLLFIQKLDNVLTGKCDLSISPGSSHNNMLWRRRGCEEICIPPCGSTTNCRLPSRNTNRYTVAAALISRCLPTRIWCKYYVTVTSWLVLWRHQCEAMKRFVNPI